MQHGLHGMIEEGTLKTLMFPSDAVLSMQSGSLGTPSMAQAAPPRHHWLLLLGGQGSNQTDRLHRCMMRIEHAGRHDKDCLGQNPAES